MLNALFLVSHSTKTDPRCSSPVETGSSDVDKQAKQNHEKSGESHVTAPAGRSSPKLMSNSGTPVLNWSNK